MLVVLAYGTMRVCSQCVMLACTELDQLEQVPGGQRRVSLELGHVEAWGAQEAQAAGGRAGGPSAPLQGYMTV